MHIFANGLRKVHVKVSMFYMSPFGANRDFGSCTSVTIVNDSIYSSLSSLKKHWKIYYVNKIDRHISSLFNASSAHMSTDYTLHGSQFYKHFYSATWNDAQDKCLSEGGQLPVVHTVELRNELRQAMDRAGED